MIETPASKLTLKGSIAKVSNVDGINHELVDNDSTVVSLLVDDKTIELWVNNTMIEEFDLEPILFFDNAVSIEVEETVAFITTYRDENDVLHFHGEQNNAIPGTIRYRLVNASHLTTMELLKSGLPASIVDVMKVIRAERLAELRERPGFKSRANAYREPSVLRNNTDSVEEIQAAIERYERKFNLATGVQKDQTANTILKLQAKLPVDKKKDEAAKK